MFVGGGYKATLPENEYIYGRVVLHLLPKEAIEEIRTRSDSDHFLKLLEYFSDT